MRYGRTFGALYWIVIKESPADKPVSGQRISGCVSQVVIIMPHGRIFGALYWIVIEEQPADKLGNR